MIMEMLIRSLLLAELRSYEWTSNCFYRIVKYLQNNGFTFNMSKKFHLIKFLRKLNLIHRTRTSLGKNNRAVKFIDVPVVCMSEMGLSSKERLTQIQRLICY